MATSKQRRIAIKPAGQPNSEINVTPLVDVVLVMLIIFMVVTPLLEKDITVRVPATEKVEQVAEVPPDQLVVKLLADGDVTINGEKVPQPEYIERLKQRLDKKRADDKLVFVVADDGANYGRLVSLLDGAKQAGAETLGMATETPEAAPAATP